MKNRWQSLAALGALLYAVLTGLWIAYSRPLTSLQVHGESGSAQANLFDGLVFVLASSLIVYLVLRRLLRTEFEARIRAETAARQLEELRTIADQSHELLYKHDLNNRFTYVSPHYQTLLGYGPEHEGADWTRFLTDNPINQKALELTQKAILTGERQPPYLLEVRKSDGSAMVMEIDEAPVKDAAGKVVALVGAARDVTERLKAEESLRVSEEKLRTLYNSMTEGMALQEILYNAQHQPIDFRYLDVNSAFEALTGWSHHKVVGQLASALYPDQQELQSSLRTYAEVAASGKPAIFETYFAPNDKHFSISVFSPRPGQFATVFADITKRKEAEEQLNLLNQAYGLVSHINEAIVHITDRDTLFREACRTAVEHGHFLLAWVGLVDEFSGNILPITSFGRDDGYVAGINASVETNPRGMGPVGKAAREKRVVVCSDIASDPGMELWRVQARMRGFGSLMAMPLTSGGKLIGVLSVYAPEPDYFNTMIVESLIEVAADLSFALDIIERNRQREAEREQLRLRQTALDAAANSIVITDHNGVIEWVNEAFTRLTGYSRTEATGKPMSILRSDVHGASFYAQLWHTVLAGQVWQGTLTNKRKNGTLYEEEMTVTPVRSAEGQITHFIAIKQDITERKKLEHQFLRAQRMESIGMLAGGVAHDLNNVLAPVLMALPLLRGEMPAEQRARIVDTLEQSVHRGADIVQQVLTFARGVEVQRVLVQARHLLREMSKIAEETFPRDIRVRSNLPQGLWPLQGDPTQIHQVLLNLAVNARDAMPEGGELTFAARNVVLGERLQFMDFEIPAGRYVTLSISDTGSGISAETLERIFEPFFTTKPPGKGTGLGLSTVLGIVKSHGGLVKVDSQPRRGSTFTVYLPAAPAETAPQSEAEHPILPQGRGETLLLVDDEPAVLEVTQSILEASGYKVLTARDGMEALARLEESGGSVQLLLTDIMMPVMNGLTLSRSVRHNYPNLPIVAATGLMNPPGDEDRASQLRELGIKWFLRKPFQAEHLLSILDEILHAQAGKA